VLVISSYVLGRIPQVFYGFWYYRMFHSPEQTFDTRVSDNQFSSRKFEDARITELGF
jgi:hypothetical protein